MNYFGYVYLWRDKKHGRYIIGSHFGTVEDRYKTSTGGIHVRNIFKSRPNDMRFRVLEYCNVDDIKELHKIEKKWLDMRPNIADNPRYFNMTNQAGGGFDAEIQHKRVKDGTHHFLGGEIQRQSNLKRVEEGTHNFQSKEHRKRVSGIAKQRCRDGSHHFVKSEFNKVAFKIESSDGRVWYYDSKVDAVNDGFKPGVIDKIKKHGAFTFIRGSKGKQRIKPGETLTYRLAYL